eukprot:TRINITY_DN11170_c0_g1_i3.p1 TRINITY_DN11170_c0_g1~~TRINITY_DN11170_c0_g1_i3.p1  ORF type:complete len:233 (-),score=8.57 TRINITY_DN11170_c0_g1_i3:23-658(-)
MSRGFFFAVLIACIAAQCNDFEIILGGGPLVSPNCPEDKPWCVPQANATLGVFCAECASDCDCPVAQYCSSDPNNFRVCQEFSADGKDCLPYRNADLTDEDIPDTYKCADIYTVTNPFTQTTNIVVNHAGNCVERKCHYCSADYPASNANSCQGSLREARACVWPGKQKNALAVAWDPEVYKNDRVAVWLAIYVVLIVILIVLQIIGAFRK